MCYFIGGLSFCQRWGGIYCIYVNAEINMLAVYLLLTDVLNDSAFPRAVRAGKNTQS